METTPVSQSRFHRAMTALRGTASMGKAGQRIAAHRRGNAAVIPEFEAGGN